MLEWGVIQFWNGSRLNPNGKSRLIGIHVAGRNQRAFQRRPYHADTVFTGVCRSRVVPVLYGEEILAGVGQLVDAH